jgi:hypothetical protein
VAHAVITGQTSGHQGGTIRHAHGIGHVKAFEAHPTGRNAIDMWRGEHCIAIATEVVSALLVCHDEQKIVRSVCHGPCPYKEC